MRAWLLRTYGEPQDVLELAEVPIPEPLPHQTLVRVEGVGIGFPDLLRIRGLYQVPQALDTPPGSELVGTVAATGSEGGLPVGTRVIGNSQIGDGALGEYALISTWESCEVPEDLPMATAATLSANYPTAMLALHTRAKVQPGEVVVVTGGAGGVGSAATQLAIAAGARVIAIDLGVDRAARCIEFGAHASIDSATQDIVSEIKAFSGGVGADVFIDTVGGDVFDVFRRCVASEGRVVIVGFTGGRIPELKLNHLILRNFTVMGVNALMYGKQWSGLMERVVDLSMAGQINPPIEAVYPFDDVPAVFARLASGLVVGRAVISVP